jgi:hypothetical protein
VLSVLNTAVSDRDSSRENAFRLRNENPDSLCLYAPVVKHLSS